MGLDRPNIGLIFTGCRSFLYSPSHDWRPQRLAIRAGKGQHGCSSMRKSKEVPITLLAALALSTTGCEPPPHHCVDSTGHLAPESYCQNQATGYQLCLRRLERGAYWRCGDRRKQFSKTTRAYRVVGSATATVVRAGSEAEGNDAPALDCSETQLARRSGAAWPHVSHAGRRHALLGRVGLLGVFIRLKLTDWRRRRPRFKNWLWPQVTHILDHNRLEEMSIPATAAARIRETWNSEPPALYGRLDLRL
jgi:hypothetical protein